MEVEEDVVEVTRLLEEVLPPDLIQEDTVPPLPDDIWRILTTYLSLKESCSLALVCQKMTVRARFHKEWRNLTLNWDKLSTAGADQLFSSPNFMMVRKLILEDFDSRFFTDEIRLLEEVLQSSLDCNTLDEIEFDDSVEDVNGDLLACAISKLVGVSFKDSITELQLNKIIKASLSSKKLLKLSLFNVALDNMEYLGDMVTQLNKLEIHSSLTTEDVRPLFDKCLQSATLTHLKLSGHDLSKVPSETLTGLCAKLHEIKLPLCTVSKEQVTNFLKACTTSSTLKVIDIKGWNLSEMTPGLLSIAFSKLSEVKVVKTRINEDQYVEIIRKSILSKKLKKLTIFEDTLGFGVKEIELVNSEPRQMHLRISLRYIASLYVHTFGQVAVNRILINSLGTCLCTLDLTGIPLSDSLLPTLISILPQLKAMNLCKSNLTTKALSSVLYALQKSTKIRKLDLSENTLSKVSADLLADVSGKLDELVVEACGLTKEQANKLLKTSAICHLNNNDLSSLEKEDIYKNMDRHKIFVATSLTTQQIIFMLKTFCKKRDHLSEFHMRNQNMSDVPKKLLSRFASKCGKVEFLDCKLSKQQELILKNCVKPQWKQLVS